MKILIGADVVPTESNKELFAKGDINTILGSELQEVLFDADYRIFNLEAPLTDTESPVAKNGPNLIVPTNTIAGYQAIKANLLTLANNHILDQGEQGLRSTCEVLDQVGIAWLGVDDTPEGAAKPYLFECDGKVIGVYACAEHEFSIVTEHSAGVNPVDPLESPNHVMELKKQCDYVIVLYHGGKEHYRYPSPNLQKTCRKLVQKGADLVVCQHSHCIGCEEKYLGGTIVYGQGNFLFDHSDSEYWQTSLLIQVHDDFKVSYLPLVKRENTVRFADDGKARDILAAFEQRSEEIRQEGFVEEQYAKFAESMLNGYLLKFSGVRCGLFFKVLNKLSEHRLTDWIVKRKYKKENLLAIQNCIECEAHRELITEAIKAFVGRGA